MMTTFFPSTVYVGLPHLHSSFIAKPASTRRISATSPFHRSRYAISMQHPAPTLCMSLRRFQGHRKVLVESAVKRRRLKRCVPRGIRTPVSDVKSRGPGPLDDGDLSTGY